jgi:hypothetical protein
MGKLINNLPAKDYHAIDALSASSAKLLLKSPAHYWAEKENPRAPTAAMKNGTLTHTLFFEPDKFEEEYAVMPKYDKRTKFGKEAAEQFEEANQGKTVIDEYAYQRAKEIVAAANANPLVAELMANGGDAEVTMQWDQYGVKCKARVDYLTSATMLDLKTCSDASPSGFARQIAAFSYHLQAAHYANGFREITGFELDRFIFVAVESEPPYATGVYVIDEAGLWSGGKMMKQAAAAYKQALKGPQKFATYVGGITTLSLPSYALVDPAFD